MDQIDKLNKSEFRYVHEIGTGKRIRKKIRVDFKLSKNFRLTDDEVFLIKKTLKMGNFQSNIRNIIPISRRLHLDFIGWDDPRYYDVLLCKNR